MQRVWNEYGEEVAPRTSAERWRTAFWALALVVLFAAAYVWAGMPYDACPAYSCGW